MNNRGKYIVFEGIDGAGKSTLIQKLASFLQQQGLKVRSTYEPTNGPIGSMIRNVLSGRIITSEQAIAGLFLADRLDHIQNPINGMLKYIDNGVNIIGDRYYLSSYAYHVPHVSLSWVIEANQVCADLLQPDITFYIDISVDESLHRISTHRQDVDLFENRERITLVKSNYENAIEHIKEKENIVRIDGEQSPEDVFQAVLSHCKQLWSIN